MLFLFSCRIKDVNLPCRFEATTILQMHCSDIFDFRNDAKADFGYRWMLTLVPHALIRIQSNNRLWLSMDISIGSIRIDSYEKQIMLDSDGEDYELYRTGRIDTGGCAAVLLKRCPAPERSFLLHGTEDGGGESFRAFCLPATNTTCWPDSTLGAW